MKTARKILAADLIQRPMPRYFEAFSFYSGLSEFLFR